VSVDIGASSSSAAASNAHAGVRLVLSGTDTTDTKAVALKSLKDGIEHELQKRREVLALLQTESRALNDRMQSLASQFLIVIVSFIPRVFTSGRQVRRYGRGDPRARDQNVPDWCVFYVCFT
jgi:hypothetical protein